MMMKITRKWILGFTALRTSHIILFIIVNLATVKSLTADVDNDIEEPRENPRRKVYDPLNYCRFYTHYYGADEDETNYHHIYHHHHRPLRPIRPIRPNKKKKKKKGDETKRNETSSYSDMYGVASAAVKTAINHFMDDSDDTRTEIFQGRKLVGQLRLFFKSMKFMYKTMKPEIKYAECARKYFYSATDREILGAIFRPGSIFKPGTNVRPGAVFLPASKPPKKQARHKKRKKKKKHKDGFHDFIYNLSESAFLTLYGGNPPKNGDFIYMNVMPFMYGLRHFYRSFKTTFRSLRHDMLVKCTSEWLAARFCIWIDTA